METNFNRLKETIEYIAKINSDDSAGVSRFSYSKEDLEVRKYLKDICESIGLVVRVDAVGNMFARFEGEDKSLKPILSGSHIDSVKSGGKFDGIVGSVAALECAIVMKENGYVPKRSYEVAFYPEEEGSNFQVPVMGSKILTGKLSLEDVKQIKTPAGKSAFDVIKEAGFTPENIPFDVIKKGDVKASVELHIEQSVRLDLEKHPIGIVEGIAGCRWYKVTFNGEQNHAGATPMNLRRDPMCAASECICQIKDIAKNASNTAVATVGVIEAFPNIPNAIPANVSFTVDIRDIDNNSMDAIVEKIKEVATSSAESNGCEMTYEYCASSNAIEIKPYIKDIMKEEAEKANLDYIFMPSGAIHDSNYLADVTDIAMIFVPSINGRSHVPDEDTKYEDIKIGSDLLLNTILRLTKE